MEGRNNSLVLETSIIWRGIELSLEKPSGVIVTDQEYPIRPAFSLLTKILDDFTAKVPQSSFGNPGSISFPEISTYIAKYQDPRQADTIMRVQQELDETKIVLVRVNQRDYQKREIADGRGIA